MARPSERDRLYEERARAMQWTAVHSLWEDVKARTTPEWDPGKALEYLVVRAFELSGLQVEYPYEVPPHGKTIEQIDGLVYLNDLAFLIECKATDSSDVEVIAKVHYQLARRPPTALACIFVAGAFTAPALALATLTVPHRVLLWTVDDIDEALRAEDFKTPIVAKYRYLCRLGLLDHAPGYGNLEILT